MNAPNLAFRLYGPRSLSGHELRGDNIVRMVYLDESGTGDAKREPIVVVAAVIIHADKQRKAIGEYISDMAQRWVPKDKWHLFKSFHAIELFAGGKVFERKKADLQYWWPILDELLAIPKNFDLPIAFGFVSRAWFEPGGPTTKSHRSNLQSLPSLLLL